MAIDRVGGLPSFRPLTDSLRPEATKTPGPTPGAEGAGFLDQLKGALNGVESGIEQANFAVTELASGQDVDLHGTMIAMEKADIALRMTVSARDKFISAYEQIMNMAV